MSEMLSFKLEPEQQSDYEFRVRFDWPGVDELLLDEPEPLGHAAGPNAARLIGAAVANRLASSLLFCMRKFKQTPGTLRAEVSGELVRNERGRVRIGRYDVTIHLADEAGAIQHFDRCRASSRISVLSPRACGRASRWTCASSMPPVRSSSSAASRLPRHRVHRAPEVACR